MLRPAAGARRANDTLAVLVHAALLALFVQTLPDFKEPWQWMLLAIEAVSLAFHLWLAAIWFTAPEEWLVGRTNWYKWVEYAITATLGTLATGFASPDAIRHAPRDHRDGDRQRIAHRHQSPDPDGDVVMPCRRGEAFEIIEQIQAEHVACDLHRHPRPPGNCEVAACDMRSDHRRRPLRDHLWTCR